MPEIDVLDYEGVEFVLSLEELQAEAGRRPRDGDGGCNFRWFEYDLLHARVFDRYPPGGYVAYYNGTFCGQSRHRDLLFERALREYGIVGTAVFRIPEVRSYRERRERKLPVWELAHDAAGDFRVF
ncbi:MAG: hypothetical protein HY518_03975 [Candidatus Aenigmarchaeota archaeon]|nr:hypothetical protein [Candidatus Aenigmarchaeota archaeon]